MWFWLSLFLVISLDQLLKWWVRVGDYFFVINTGIAFSLGTRLQWVEWMVYLAFAILVIAKFRVQNTEFRIQKKVEVFFWGLFVGGAVSNLIDRLLVGGVVDYISVWRFPVFNLGDAGISLGVLFLVYTWIYVRFKHKDYF